MVPIIHFSRGGSWLLAAVLVGGLILAGAVGRRVERVVVEEGAGLVPDRGDETEQVRAILDRIARKSLVVEDLVAGRLTLLQAASHFRALNLEPPPLRRDVYHYADRGDTDEERYCREVIDWVQMHLEETDPCLSLATSARLVDELEKHLRRGRLRLPAVPKR
jgi:hypothetical protein